MSTRQPITERSGVHKPWYSEARKQTLRTLPKFIRHLLNDYEHDYGTICHAITAGALATMWAMNEHEQGGITGFQAGAIMWEFIQHWSHSGNKCGLRLVDYDHLLYPQYEDDFERTISQYTMDRLQEEALKNLAVPDRGVPRVREHWQRLAQGLPPFGFRVIPD